MEDKKCEILEQKMCREIELIEQKYANNQTEMSMQDLEKIDKLYHALKSMATYNAMKEASEYDGVSGRRGRSPSTGRYVSRSDGNSYEEGYSQGYSEAMSQIGHGDHYISDYNHFPRRW